MSENHQVLIVGGGPAAHGAALVLGRARKRVLVCDEGKPANRVAEHSHSFFTRDGAPPLELRRIAREQLASYGSVRFLDDRVESIRKTESGFDVEFAASGPASARFVLLALGMEVVDPGIPGFQELWGNTVVHCPYCHGWELRDRPWAAFLTGPGSPVDPPKLCSWSDDVVLIIDDEASIPAGDLDRWRALGLGIERGSIERLQIRQGQLSSVELLGGRQIPCGALLYSPARRQAPIVEALGLELGDDGYVTIDASGQTSVEGIYAAGDMTSPRHQIVFAAASGSYAGMAIDGALAANIKP